MRKIMLWGIAIAAILSGVAGGYRLGSGQWPAWHAIALVALSDKPAASEAAPAERTILYWKHPDGAADFSATPKKAPDGRDYLPVFEDQEADFKEPKAKPAADAKKGKGKILHYRNPMGLPDTSPEPKKDWMGMDYIPVYEGEEESGSAIKVSLDKVQRSGVRTEAAEMRRIARPVRAPAVSKPDERTLWSVTLRADAFIEELHVNETGKHVKAGERLFRFYSPQVVSAQIDYRTSVAYPTTPTRGGEPAGLQRLKNLGLPESVLNQIRASPTPVMAIDWPAPVTGVVMEKRAISGQMVKAGEELYRLADLTSIWVIADVAEQDIGQVRVGAPAKIAFRAFPDQPFDGRVTFVLHELDARTRTGKVRIEVRNPEYRIKHEMYADVEIDAAAGEPKRLTVPVSAVIDSGSRQVVIVERGEGLFEPRPVKLGLRGDGFVEIREGLKAGDKVVIAANFLIDAESNLRAALKGFTADGPTPPQAPEAKK